MSNTIKQKYIALIIVLLFSTSLSHLQNYICDLGVSFVIKGFVKFATALDIDTITNLEHTSLTLNQNHVPPNWMLSDAVQSLFFMFLTNSASA